MASSAARTHGKPPSLVTLGASKRTSMDGLDGMDGVEGRIDTRVTAGVVAVR
jgi:hypothetical protein